MKKAMIVATVIILLLLVITLKLSYSSSPTTDQEELRSEIQQNYSEDSLERQTDGSYIWTDAQGNQRKISAEQKRLMDESYDEHMAKKAKSRR